MEDYDTPIKRHKEEETFAKLQHVEALIAHDRPVTYAIRSIGKTKLTYYRWRSEFGGLKGDQVKRLKELEAENTRLRRAVSELMLKKLIPKEGGSEKFLALRVVAPPWSMWSQNMAS